MTKPKTREPTTAEILKLLPVDVQRVQVKDVFGHVKWRPVKETKPGDVVVMNDQGVPYTMTTSPGRKPAVPITAASPVVEEIVKRKREHIRHDPVLAAVRQAPESSNVLHEIMIALGEEAASLGFERTEAERKGQDTSQLSNRRVNALKAQVDTWLKRKDQLGTGGVDLESPGYESVFQLTVDTFCEALRDCRCQPELIEAVRAKFVKRVNAEEWQIEAKKRAKEATSG